MNDTSLHAGNFGESIIKEVVLDRCLDDPENDQDQELPFGHEKIFLVDEKHPHYQHQPGKEKAHAGKDNFGNGVTGFHLQFGIAYFQNGKCATPEDSAEDSNHDYNPFFLQ